MAIVIENCVCGGRTQPHDYMGGDRSASISCLGCGVSLDAGSGRDIRSAAERWQRLQTVLKAAGWRG